MPFMRRRTPGRIKHGIVSNYGIILAAVEYKNLNGLNARYSV